jgi:hypothetical protein
VDQEAVGMTLLPEKYAADPVQHPVGGDDEAF